MATKKEHAIGFTQWIIDNLIIVGVDTFCHPDNIQEDFTSEKAYKMYMQYEKERLKELI